LIELIKPNVLVKGGDYSRKDVVGADFVEANGGEIVLVDLVPGVSTTALVDQMSPKKDPK
jgi:D-beta-D-heptose 7-phosphate kinase/D-beta-D-heptose 1-phosphate adenosyltransferase